jgi:hypothetical protein
MSLIAGYSKRSPPESLPKRFSCKTPCQIFTGRNALRGALFWCETGRDCGDPHILFELQRGLEPLEIACSWHKAPTSLEASSEISGEGVHAKFYKYKNYLIFSSQNNGNSPLFETAIVFKQKPALLSFFKESFKNARLYQKWWKINKTY